MEQYELERKEAVKDIQRQIRLGYDQIKRGQTVHPDDVLAEIYGMSSIVRKASKRQK